MVPALTSVEVEDYRALGVPIEALLVPDELLEQAVAEKRVEETITKLAAAGNADAQRFLRDFPVELVVRGLRGR